MAKRDAIIEFYRKSKIIKQLKLPKSTVYDTVRSYKKLGNIKDCPKSDKTKLQKTKPKLFKRG